MPETKEEIETDNIFLLHKNLGTFPSTILLESSSTIAVLPTPASPTNNGLFFVLLDNISISLFTSISLSITGSISPLITLLLKLTEKSFTKRLLSLFIFFTINLLEKSSYIKSISIFIPIKILIATPSPSSKREMNNCSNVTSFSFFSLLSKEAFSIIFFKSGVYKYQVVGLLPFPIIFSISL